MKQLYISIPQRIQMDKSEVTIGDFAQVIAADKKLESEVKKVHFLTLQRNQLEVKGIVDVYEILTKQFGDLNIVNLGESEFILELKQQKKPNKLFEYAKIAVVCGIVYLGSAFSVMTFNEDGCVRDLLDMLYKSIMGKPKENGIALELAYSLGITLGILMFYNHVFRKKKETDPTPIQVEMRQYEMNVNQTTIINKDRESGN